MELCAMRCNKIFLGWATDGSGSDVKIYFTVTWNHGFNSSSKTFGGRARLREVAENALSVVDALIPR